MIIDKRKISNSFSAGTYRHGEALFEQEQVLSCEVYSAYGTVINAVVQDGSVVYRTRVEITFFHENIQSFCSCGLCACRHAAAACAAFLARRYTVADYGYDDEPQTDLVDQIIHGYLSIPAGGNEKPVRLQPELKLPEYRHEQPYVSFKIGRDKMYAVRNVTQLIKHIQNGDMVTYGKNLAFGHSRQAFDPASLPLLDLIDRQVHDHLGYQNHFNDDGGYRLPMLKNHLPLCGRFADELFEVCRETRPDSLTVTEHDPEVVMSIRQMPDNRMLVLLKPEFPLITLDSGSALYTLHEHMINRCSEDFRRKVGPLLEKLRQPLQLSAQQAQRFVSCVLPSVKDQLIIDDPFRLTDSMLPEECTPRFYFDWKKDGLLCRLAYVYGELQLDPQDTTHPLNRNHITQAETEAFLAARMQPITRAHYELQNENAVMELLTGGLADFRARGEVMVSDRLQSLELHPAAPMVGLSIADGMLTLDMDTGGFPPEELQDLYNSLILKRRWHKLKDGRFVQLNGSGLESLAEAAHMSRLTPQELKRGKVTMPAFRSLYLDHVFSGDDLRVTRNAEYRRLVRSFKTVAESDDALPQGFDNVLRGYQETGFRWLKTLERSGFGGILADEMGLGKTLQTITYLATVPRSQTGMPSLIVCPASLILNWADEFKRFAPGIRFVTIAGSAAERAALLKAVPESDADVLVTGYDLLKRDIDRYAGIHFHTCVLDEGQFIKNQSTKGSQAVKRILADHRFVLTGTPIENRLSELWNLFDFIMPGYLYSHTRFVEQLERPVIKSGSEEARRQLSAMVQPFLLRRMKKDVLRELPPKLEYTRRVSLSEEERKLYAAFVQKAKAELNPGSEKMAILAALTRLRQICCSPSLCVENYRGESSKLQACTEMVKEMAENGHQILLFSQFTSMLAMLREQLQAEGVSTFTLQGDTPREERARLVKEFNLGHAQVFLISLKAGGTGLNLTAADVVIHYDPWWNAAAQNQATDRAHRIGQKSCVEVYRLIAENTVEEKIRDLQEKKAELLNQVTVEGGDGILSMSAEDLLALMGD